MASTTTASNDSSLCNRLISALSTATGKTARQLAKELQEDRTLVNSTLYKESTTFRRSTDAAPLWFLCASRSPLPPPTLSSTIDVPNRRAELLQLYQRAADTRWRQMATTLPQLPLEPIPRSINLLLGIQKNTQRHCLNAVQEAHSLPAATCIDLAAFVRLASSPSQRDSLVRAMLKHGIETANISTALADADVRWAGRLITARLCPTTYSPPQPALPSGWLVDVPGIKEHNAYLLNLLCTPANADGIRTAWDLALEWFACGESENAFIQWLSLVGTSAKYHRVIAEHVQSQLVPVMLSKADDVAPLCSKLATVKLEPVARAPAGKEQE